MHYILQHAICFGYFIHCTYVEHTVVVASAVFYYILNSIL
jgi:hypothetical protein